MSAATEAKRIRAWLQDEARDLNARDLVAAFCGQIETAGVRIDRLSIHLRHLHPLFLAHGYVWESETRETYEVRREHGVQFTEEYLKSPVRIAYEEGRTVRYPLEGQTALPFDLLGGLRDRGFTEYVMFPLFFRRGTNQACSISTKLPGGFTDDCIELMQAVLPTLTIQLELLLLESTAGVLLDTYMGPRAGRKVLAGQITRGDTQTIPAVLWYCDLRGFTSLTEKRGAEDVVEVLNAYFQAMAAPVEEAGGEILKFIGDAMLAIWPLPERRHQATATTEVAIAASEEAVANMDAVNAEREKAGETPLGYGLALHIGDVLWGNIGAADRLDFTVIGPAVNLVARLDDVARELGESLVFSEVFHETSSRVFDLIGAYPLKGIANPQNIYRLKV